MQLYNLSSVITSQWSEIYILCLFLLLNTHFKLSLIPPFSYLFNLFFNKKYSHLPLNNQYNMQNPIFIRGLSWDTVLDDTGKL